MVSIQQAAANAFAAWLGAQLSGVQVLPRWPAPDAQMPFRSITVTTAGRRRDTNLDVTLISSTPNGSLNADSRWLVAACYQPIQMDIWSQNPAARDDLIARLDILLRSDAAALTTPYNPMPLGTGNGVLVNVGDGWPDTIADFSFGDPDTEENGGSYQAQDYRAMYVGGAHVMLSVAATTARQKIINFQQRISEADTSYQDF